MVYFVNYEDNLPFNHFVLQHILEALLIWLRLY